MTFSVSYFKGLVILCCQAQPMLQVKLSLKAELALILLDPAEVALIFLRLSLFFFGRLPFPKKLSRVGGWGWPD